MAQNPVADLFGVLNQFIRPLQQEGVGALSNPGVFLAPVINHLLARDADCQRRLRQQAGKVLELRAEPIVTRLFVNAAGLLEAAQSASTAHTTISVPLADAMNALRDRQRAMATTRIEGDVELAATLSYLVEHLRWDPEDDLASIIGDTRAVMVMRFFSQFAQGVVDTGSRFSAMSREYVVNEQNLVVTRPELDQFADHVRTLRDDCARLEKRVEMLGKQASGGLGEQADNTRGGA